MTAHVTPRTKAHARRRYRRRYARHKPVVVRRRMTYGLARIPALTLINFHLLMRMIVAMRFGQPGKWGQGRFQHATKKGPGRRPIARCVRVHPAGSKLVKRFIRDARGENVGYRKQYLAMTGKNP